MGILTDFLLNSILRMVPGAWWAQDSRNMSHDESDNNTAVEEPEVARPPDQDADAEIGLASPREQLPTTANRASVVSAEGERTVWATKLRYDLKVSLTISSMAIGILVDLLFIHPTKEPFQKTPSLIVTYISTTLSFASSVGLIWGTTKQMSASLPILYSWVNKLLLFLSIISMGFALISLMVFFMPKSYYYLPIVLVPTLSVIGISFYDVSPRDGDVTLGEDDPHKSDKKRSFQLTINMSTFSFMGTLGTIIGCHKNSSNRANHSYVKVSITCMLGAAITGLVNLLVNRPLKRKDWKKTAVGNVIMLCLLVLAVLTIAATFLEGILAATLFPVPVAVAIFCFMEYYVVPRNDQADLDTVFTQEKELKPLYAVALTTMSMSFGAVMTIFSGFLGGEAKDSHLEVCIFFVVACFVSSVSLGIVTFRIPKKASFGAIARALACLTLVLLVLAALALINYVGS